VQHIIIFVKGAVLYMMVMMINFLATAAAATAAKSAHPSGSRQQ
jgi:hypothetical protein